MEGAKKNFWAAGGVLVVLAALVGGSASREQVEAGPGILQQANRSSLFASLEEDPTVPESDFFYQLSQLVKREYVDPITEDHKLAEGAVRGMITGLGDPEAEFLKKEQFEAFKKLQAGTFEGIGVELDLHYDAEQKKWMKDLDAIRDNPGAESPITTPGVLIPSVVVTAVAPGGVADRAGIQVGDVIVGVDGKPVLDSGIFRQFQELQRKVRKGDAKVGELASLRKALSEDAKNGMSPVHAREKLVTGTTGQVSVIWTGRGGRKEATLAKESRTVEAVTTSPDGTIQVRFFVGSAEKLARALADKSAATIDLRNATAGDYNEVVGALEKIAPAGVLGNLATERPGKPRTLTVKHGIAAPPKLRLLVDGSTRGATEIFAQALVAAGEATLVGSTAGDPVDREVVELPTGAGYLLPIGRFAAVHSEKTR